MGRGSSDAISAPPPPTPTAADATVSGSGSTSASSRATTLVERQIIITINITDPAATISALSSSLAVAQRSVTLLANEVQQVQLASVRAVASAQSAAAASALSTVASVSSSAALALASASTLVSNAGAAAVAASRSADAAIANASSIQAQADLSRRLDANRFTETQLVIAIVVSIIGTLALSLTGFLLFLNYREKRDKKRKRQLKEFILRPDTSNSSGSGDVIWDERYTRPAPQRPPRNPTRPRMAQIAPPRGPPRVPMPQPPRTIREEREPPERPMSSESNSTGPVFSLFPKVVPGDLRETQSPRQFVDPRSPNNYGDTRI